MLNTTSGRLAREGVLALTDKIELARVGISLLAMIAAFVTVAVLRGQSGLMRGQSTLMREQLEESRLDSCKRRRDLSASIADSLDGSVRASHVNFPYGVPVISVSEEPDNDGIAHVTDLVRRYGYGDLTIDVQPDLV